jgi:hypothetical protein
MGILLLIAAVLLVVLGTGAAHTVGVVILAVLGAVFVASLIGLAVGATVFRAASRRITRF